MTARPTVTTTPPDGPERARGHIRLRIDLAYDGSAFRGFAAQPGLRTVEGVLADAIGKLAGTAVALTVAGRTDKGVHAASQTVHVDVPVDSRIGRAPEGARSALDGICGPEIAIWRVRAVPATFDARFSANQRRYRYHLCDAQAMDPRWRHDTWHVGPPRLDTESMDQGGSHLLGEHDFSSFCRQPSPGAPRHLVRRVDRLVVRRRPRGHVEVAVEGPAFCHQMVRSVVGCLLRVGRGQRDSGWVREVLAARDRQAVGQVAPPRGLVLVGVSYGPARDPHGADEAS